MKIPPWYVLTGGPCSGKTTLLEELHRLKYFTVPEAARELINKFAAEGVKAKDTWESQEMQRIILEKKLEMEEYAPRNRTVFFDRGIPDSIAYFKVLGMDTKELEKISRNRYKKVFFLDMLPFRNDSARTESKAMAKKLERLLLGAYESLHYDITRIPKATVAERLKLIFSGI